MGKQGPCYHCGVTSTPLWRNGPPEKPVLCNACGSRWRTKGTLTNYTPLHARGDIVDSRDYKITKVKSISIKIKEPKPHKRKHFDDNAEVEGEAPNSGQNFRRALEEDTSNRSSSGSAISYSESCGHFGSTDASDITGSAQSIVWDSLVPSRKRTCIGRPKPSRVEKLTKDLYCILHEQQSSYLSGSSEEDLLFETETPAEIGHGGILIKHPYSVAREEESEASSLPIDNKTYTANDAYSGSTSLPVHIENKGMGIPNVGNGKVKKIIGLGAQENTKRDKPSHDKLHFLLNSNSPLKSIDLRDVVSFEELSRNFTHEEQQQLMKHLPSVDTAKMPDSLESMFDAPQFVETLTSFQQLLLEGAFDLSFPGVNAEECRVLKRLALANSTKSKWVEQYKFLKDAKLKQMMEGKGVGASSHGCGDSASIKRPHDGQNQNFPEPKGTLKSPKRVNQCGSISLPSTKPSSSSVGTNTSYDTKDIDNDGSYFSPRSLFAFPPDQSSVMLDSLKFTDNSSDQDLLLDVPSYTSFPQAELLNCHLSKWSPPNSSQAENQDLRKEEVLSNRSSLSFTRQQPSNSSVVYPCLILH
ncbi:GATA transcription factor 27-like [Magnolia sinica]|uniref:GATA transcription factor 27-like n=1 Tax=Magnolia sinica TaxID=86752 RepID=UPI002658A5B3|nr:GATA transcription factor 27-like [Magnolia sinica]